MRSWALAAFVAGLAAFAALAAIPFLTEQRTFPGAITSPPPLQAVSLDTVRPGARLCMRDVTAEAHSEVGLIKVGTFKKPGPPLEVTVAGAGGYRSSGRVAGGYADNSVQAFHLDPPPSARLVTVCVENAGDSRIALYSAADRAQSRAQVTIDGSRASATPQLAFWEEGRASFADRAATTVKRLSIFRGPLGYSWAVWAVLALFALGLPAAVGLALARGLGR